MKKTLGQSIEKLIREHLAEQKEELQQLVSLAFGEKRKSMRNENICRARRSRETLEDSASRLLAAVKNKPGETMQVLSADLGLSAVELHLPQVMLKKRKQIRTVGQRNLMRYFSVS